MAALFRDFLASKPSLKDEQVYSAVSSRFGIANRAVLFVRLKMFQVLSGIINFEELEKVLDVGVTANQERLGSNYFEAMFPYKDRLTCLSDQDAGWLEERYPGCQFVKGDGRTLPFYDNSFDLVFSNAVLEHVGSEAQQEKFIMECVRVSRRFLFLTTPNRYHPIELHTALPFIHWFPKIWHRRLLNILGYKQLSKEENLNLLSRRDLKFLTRNCLNIKDIRILSVNFLGFPSNLILYMEKTTLAQK